MTDSVEGNSLLNNLKTGRLIKPSATVSNRAAPHPVALAPGAISNSFDTNAAAIQEFFQRRDLINSQL